MMNAKVYKKTKVVETPLATVQIESEFYEPKPNKLGEGPPRWLVKTDPSQPHPDAKKQTDQRHHMDILFQLGQQHQSDAGEEKSAGSCDNETNEESLGAHRSASSRHLDSCVSHFGKEECETVQKNAAETYLGISLRDISNKLFMTSIPPITTTSTTHKEQVDGVEETKEEKDEDNLDLTRHSALSSITAFDIGKVLPMNLLDSMSFLANKTEEAPLTDPANGKAPLFTEEMREKQEQSLLPLDEIRILDPCVECNTNLLTTVDDSDTYLRPAQSDEMSCVTIPNMNDA